MTFSVIACSAEPYRRKKRGDLMTRLMTCVSQGHGVAGSDEPYNGIIGAVVGERDPACTPIGHSPGTVSDPRDPGVSEAVRGFRVAAFVFHRSLRRGVSL